MIKKYLFGIGIAILGFIGFSNAGLMQMVGIEGQPSMYDSNFNLTFLKGGGLLSSYLGQGKSILAIDSQTFFWWSTNGQPYYYSNGLQGFFGEYWSCDLLTGYDSVLSNCNSSPITGDYQELFKAFFNNVKQYDLVYYDFVKPYNNSSANGSSRGDTIQVCWSSEIIGKTLCFRKSSCYNSNSLNSCYGRNYGSLVNSQELSNLSFSLIPYSWIGYAPGQAGYGGGGNIEGGSSTSDQVIMTGDLLYQKCTNSYVLSQIDKTYGSQMFRPYCHAGTFDTGSIIGDYTGVISYIPGLGVDFKYVYNNTKNGQSWNHWYESNLNAMARYKNGDFGPTNPFIGSPLYLYTYFENLYNGSFHLFSDISSYDVLNYCQLMLYSDLDTEYKGSYYKSYCDDLQFKNDFSNITTGEVGTIDDDEILPPGFDTGGGDTSSSGTVVGADWSGVLSGDTNKNYDGKNFINDFYQKLKLSYQKPTNGLTGIIPTYILVFMFALILFRFISH